MVAREFPKKILVRPAALGAAACAIVLTLSPVAPAFADETVHRHAMSLVRPPKYPADFKHFDYVNPDAPKGGEIRETNIQAGTFDSVNPIPLKGEKALGLGLLFETLMARSLEESSTQYGLIAEWASYPDDYSSVTFKLRDEARWQDGAPITPEDVLFSMEVLQKNNPFYGEYYKNVVKGEKTGDREVTFTFDSKGNRELPQIVGELSVFPKHFWEAKDAGGAQRDPARTTLEPLLGSGPYRIKSIDPGRSLTYERIPDYWAKDLGVRKGQYNFDKITYDFYREVSVAFEAFKADHLDYWHESSSKTWATGYDFPAIKNGWVIKRDDIHLKTGQPMQGFAMNIRRSIFSDPRVRHAFNLAFDFEWANQNIFYGQYARTSSYFENSELAATGLPQGRELEILENLRTEVPPEAFTEPYKNPVNATPDDLRTHLREAVKLLQAAGWEVKDGVLTNKATGEPMTVEFLVQVQAAPLWERIIGPYIANLQKLGVKSQIRAVDPPQYKQRTDNFDFDIIIESLPQSDSPGNEQRGFWSSAAADTPGSRNAIGIKNPAVDKLVDMIIFAKDRDELVAATHALDRVLLWNHYVVPQWHLLSERIAYWDRFGIPKTAPSTVVGADEVWWFDKERAAKLEAAHGASK
jgi:microcin C transport system substrate-binding protein